jgi:hypothetical protein
MTRDEDLFFCGLPCPSALRIQERRPNAHNESRSQGLIADPTALMSVLSVSPSWYATHRRLDDHPKDIADTFLLFLSIRFYSLPLAIQTNRART